VQQQLQAIVDSFGAAQRHLHQIADDLPESLWSRRPDPAKWSVAECVAHLNLTARAYLPLIRAALARGVALGEPAPVRYRRDPVGWLLWRMARPPVRHRVPTTAPFVPSGDLPRTEVLAEFDRLQEEQVAAVHASQELPIGRLWIRSPFDPRLRYNLYAALTILPVHQERHLWQAEQVLAVIRPAGA
jgi:DinB superfamily